MRAPIELADFAWLKDFAGIAVEVLDSNISSITGESPGFVISEAAKATADDLAAAYPAGVILNAADDKTGFDLGLIFNIKDITSIADMMLLGDGASKDDLDSDSIDAIREIGNQFFGALTVPVESKLGKRVQFKLDKVEKISAKQFEGDEYLILDLKGAVKGNTVQLTLYMDDDMQAVFDKQEDSLIDTSQFFKSSSEEEDDMAGFAKAKNHVANMDMLLDIEIPLSVRMGSAKLFLKDILGLGPGNIVELDQSANEPIELMVNGKLVARGEVVIVDGYFGFRIKEIISKAERIKKLKD